IGNAAGRGVTEHHESGGIAMRAMIINQFGGPEVFKEADIPIPALKPGHILIRVRATSVNPVDCLIRSLGPPFAPALPAVLHGDVAGTVERVAPDVVTFKAGDEVYACAGGVIGSGGALAEYMLADTALVAHKPKTLSWREAAALPLVAITAWEGIFNRTRIQPGQTVLIHGGAGGVGHIAAQLAQQAGAHVFVTVSSEHKAQLARTLGITGTINYRQESVDDYVARVTGGDGFDVVFDTVGGGNLAASFVAAKRNGAVVTTVALGSFDLAPVHMKALSLHVIFMLIPLIYAAGRAAHGALLHSLSERIDQRQLRPLLDPHDFGFTDVAAAHELLESGQAVGKVVLQVAP
ncbi:MAG TPA: zinc-dependent alcohol dehydrogenase family protein, partial [Acidiferrobacteraceae bacterium]|nr:zinc-dependent alcohol dehydrogenase family protein [Acidiferrobacteraceae bacterium]